MTEAEFNRLASAGHNRVPVVLETFADLDTPLSICKPAASSSNQCVSVPDRPP